MDKFVRRKFFLILSYLGGGVLGILGIEQSLASTLGYKQNEASNHNLGVPVFSYESANLISTDRTFYHDRARGWFWYEKPHRNQDDIEVYEEPMDTKNINEEQAQDGSVGSLDEKDFDINNLSSGLTTKNGRLALLDINKVHAKELKVWIPKALERAIDSANINDVYNYFFLQKLALDKSERFERLAQTAVLTDALIDEMPSTQASIEARLTYNKEQENNTYQMLKLISKKAGLVFYYKGTCGYCKLAAPSINALSEIGFKIVGVTLDNTHIEGLELWRSSQDITIPLELNIKSVPAIIYLEPQTQKRLVISTGLINRAELFDRIIRAAMAE